ncbi:MAG: hypothetical protein KDC48_17840, partial [Planctomycetes bacterium]|nr:hypothetical protein [Planctomycetota bacterium]
FGHRIEWHFARDQRRLELTLLGEWDNAQSGYGFIELGDAHGRDDDTPPYGLNFDVLAHEVGHSIVYSVIGVPNAATEAGEYFGFHESAADIVALLTSLHFDSVIDEVLAATGGNLFLDNEASRIAELTKTTQVRVASNSLRMDDFVDGWSDEHAMSMPLTGALFDFLLDVFHAELLARGAISPRLARAADTLSDRPADERELARAFHQAYARAPRAFADALKSARDITGRLISATWSRLSPHRFSYARLARTMLAVDRAAGGRWQRELRENFAWRSIGRLAAGPRVAGGADHDHADHTASARTLTPDTGVRRRPTYRERALLAGQRLGQQQVAVGVVGDQFADRAPVELPVDHGELPLQPALMRRRGARLEGLDVAGAARGVDRRRRSAQAPEGRPLVDRALLERTRPRRTPPEHERRGAERHQHGHEPTRSFIRHSAPW